MGCPSRSVAPCLLPGMCRPLAVTALVHVDGCANEPYPPHTHLPTRAPPPPPHSRCAPRCIAVPTFIPTFLCLHQLIPLCMCVCGILFLPDSWPQRDQSSFLLIPTDVIQPAAAAPWRILFTYILLVAVTTMGVIAGRRRPAARLGCAIVGRLSICYTLACTAWLFRREPCLQLLLARGVLKICEAVCCKTVAAPGTCRAAVCF